METLAFGDFAWSPVVDLHSSLSSLIRGSTPNRSAISSIYTKSITSSLSSLVRRSALSRIPRSKSSVVQSLARAACSCSCCASARAPAPRPRSPARCPNPATTGPHAPAPQSKLQTSDFVIFLLNLLYLWKLQTSSILYLEGNLETKIFNDPITGLTRRVREIAIRRDDFQYVLSQVIEKTKPLQDGLCEVEPQTTQVTQPNSIVDGKSIMVPDSTTNQDTLASCDEFDNDVGAICPLPNSEFNSPLQVTPLFRSMATRIPSPQFSANGPETWLDQRSWLENVLLEVFCIRSL